MFVKLACCVVNRCLLFDTPIASCSFWFVWQQQPKSLDARADRRHRLADLVNSGGLWCERSHGASLRHRHRRGRTSDLACCAPEHKEYKEHKEYNGCRHLFHDGGCHGRHGRCHHRCPKLFDNRRRRAHHSRCCRPHGMCCKLSTTVGAAATEADPTRSHRQNDGCIWNDE